MGGRAIMSDDEDEVDEVEDEEMPRRGGKGDFERRDDDGDEEEEEEEGQDEYEKDGFIVDDVEEDEDEEENNEDSDDEKHRKKKRKKRESERNYVLDEDDYELLQDNNINVHRPKPTSKFKRLKKAGRDSEVVERSGFSDDEESERADLGGRSAEEKLKRSLFGDDEGAPFEDIAEEEEQPEEEDGDLMGEDDEMADFIVDEEDVDENGTIMRRPKVKKKKSRQPSGVSSSAMQEAQEIFGDVDEILMLRKEKFARSSNDWVEKRLEDEFEPFILSEKYMTAKDDAIRDIDIPERIQLVEELTGPPPQDDKSIAEESTWIYDQLTNVDVSPLIGEDFELSKDIDKENIGQVLMLLHCQKLDIPFIAKYRREFIRSFKYDIMPENEDDRTPMRRHKVLWAVHGLDKKWLLLQKRKSALQMYYSKRFEEEARRIDDETRHSLNKQIFSSILEALNEAKSERVVDDVDSKFNLHFPSGEIDVEEGQFKRPKRKSLYSICYKAGLWEVANKFGFNSEQFGLHLSLEKMRLEELQDGKEVPEEVARNFTCAMFEKAEDVLKGARHMAAVEIGCEPVVRNHVRSIFLENAVVTTIPTPEGNHAIDDFHQFYAVKRLRNKPLSNFTDAQWLLIQKAEQEKLLQVNITLPEAVKSKLLSDASECYLSECVSKPAQLWNEQRKMILEDSFNNFILPSMEKEARSLLTARAKHWLQLEYAKQLWDRVSVAPYQRKGSADDNDNEDGSELRVMACCSGSGKSPHTFVLLDPAGEVVDIIYAGSINIRSQGIVEQQRRKGDQERLLRFITEHQPHVGCVGASGLQAKHLKEEIYEIIFKIVEDHPRDVSQDMNIAILWGDESLPRLYENSRISSDQLPGQPGIVKRAVALGRYLQNPLAMVATLCGPGKEILSWKLCPLDDFLTPDEKYDMVEQIMVDATNHVGVDLNLASSHEWLFAPLQFVAGLGPRKASSLQRSFVRSGSIFSRKEISNSKIIRKKVFINVIGFLRIRRSGAAAATSHMIDPLDDTRIHPESYNHAKHMAIVVESEAALDDVNEIDEYSVEMAIERVRENSETLESLLISEFAKSIFEKGGVDKRETLADIKSELLHGYKEGRYPFREPNQDEEFSMLTGETDETLAEGRSVEATVLYPQDNRVVCLLDCGLRAIINAEDYSDDGYDPEKVKKGNILTSKIKSVQKNRYLVYLTSKESEMRKRQYAPLITDPFFHEEDDTLHSEQDKARKEKELAKKRFKPRMIIHPRFQNVTADEAMEFLADKDAGESIIRPSSKGPSYLTLTLKISNGVFAHKDIVESGKDHKDMTSLLRIGKTLTIDKDTFEDLDEVMDRYVDPLVTNLKNMLSYRKFRWGSKSDVDDLLKKEKAENSMRIVYSFGISHDHPGTFVLSYIRSSNPHHEYVGLYPKGFRFRKRDFEDIDRLVSYFQKNIDKPPPESGPSIQTVAAKVPMKSPSWAYSGDGSFGGGSNSDGWSNQPSDRERSSTPGSRTGGRGGRDHPSGVPRPGRGRGRGRGRDSDNDSKWGSNSNDVDGGLSNFAGAKVQDSPGRERFPGGWGGSSGRGGGGGGGGWGSSSPADTGGGSGWSGSVGGGGSGFGGRGRGNARNNKGGWGGDDAGSGAGSDGGWGSESMAGKSPAATDSGFGGGSSEWSGTKRVVPPPGGGGGGGGGWSGGNSSGGGWD